MNYLALSIGPIIETLSYCKKTRELWVGSYFFSYFMRTLIGELGDDVDMILPYVPSNKDERYDMLTKYKEEGIFHDRFIASSEDKNKEALKELIESSIDKALNSIISKDNLNMVGYINEKDSTAIKEVLKSYLQYHYIIATEEELISSTGKDNIIFAIDAILDSMELQTSFDSDNSTKVCKVNRDDYSVKTHGLVTPLAKLQYEAKSMKDIIDNTNFGFKSIPKIAVSDIVEKLSEDKEYKKILDKLEKDEERFWTLKDDPYDTFYNAINRNKDFKPHHKYYAVIYADGDKMGSTIKSIYEGDDKDGKIKQFSKNIYEYISHDETDKEDNKQTSLYKIIDDFGGMLIFAGGDDLLFFAPIFGVEARTVFDLLEEIAKRFKDQMKVGAESVDVSLSFGMSIQYYKSPMIEAIERSKKLLFSDAKKHNTKKTSGSLALELTKHSGQSFKAIFFINDDEKVYGAYKKLFTQELSRDIELPHNIQYALQKYEYLIVDIFANYKEDATARIEALFTKMLEIDMRSDKAKEGIKLLQEYILKLAPSSKDEFKKLTTQLAIIKFLRGDQ